jgi:hypothetical protein
MKVLAAIKSAGNSIDNLCNKISIRGILNSVLYTVVTLFFMSCGSNAADYATDYGKRQSDSILASVPPPTYDPSTGTVRTTMSSPATRKVQDTIVTIKSASQIASETAENAKETTEAAILEAEQRLADLRTGKVLIGTPPMIPGTDTLSPAAQHAKVKSPALPEYKCPCETIHTVVAGTTPSGVVAYYKAKYPKMTLTELGRINQPGVLGAGKFRPGLKVCLKRKKA